MFRGRDFTFRDNLAGKIIKFIEFGATAKPFRWTYHGKILKAV